AGRRGGRPRLIRHPARLDGAEHRRDRHDGAAGRDAARQGATDIRARAGVIDPFTLFVILLKASSLSLGGFGSLPLLRQDLVVTGIATEAQIVEALAIGRLSTGPNGLYVVILGYQLAGLPGAALATVAATGTQLVTLSTT